MKRYGKRGDWLLHVLLARYEELAEKNWAANEQLAKSDWAEHEALRQRDEAEQARRAAIETANGLRDLVVQCKARLGLPPDCEPLPPVDNAAFDACSKAVDEANAERNDLAERLEASRQVAEERQETILAVRRELANVNRDRLDLRRERDKQRELLGQRDRQMTELVQERSALIVEKDVANKEAERWKKLAYADPDVRAQELEDVRAERDKLERDRDEWKERCQSEWRKQDLLDPELLDGWAPAVYRADTNGHWRWLCSLDDPNAPVHDTAGPVMPEARPGFIHRLERPERNAPGLYQWDEDLSEWRPSELFVGSGTQDAGPVLPKERTANGYFELTEEQS